MSSVCAQPSGQDDREFWDTLSARIAGDRVPYYGSLALTHRCNLRCVHCFIREEGEGRAAGRELDSGQWKRIIDEAGEAGCLNLVLTGGEPLLRADFAEIYAHAKRKGFLVTLFTNGTLIDGEMLALFRELPPRLVDVSLYGASEETCRRITGSPDSFARALAVIDAMLAQGTRVALKSVMMTLNEGEFGELEALAKSRGIRFRRDAAIFPAFSGDRSPLDLRVSPEKAVELELSVPEVISGWREYLDRYGDAPAAQSIYSCGAGLTTFHVDPFGVLHPCVMARAPRYPLASGRFADGWNEMAHVRDLQAPADFRCRDCRMKLACGYCPGFFAAENGSEEIPSDYLCRIGKLRYERITQAASGG
jgi:radical SAM protein with 4Fe4S-binding SPASM domain